tara:strand:- start:561 stop:740 length:180 start_codon:yes stop_codon:yes gene_type:complete
VSIIERTIIQAGDQGSRIGTLTKNIELFSAHGKPIVSGKGSARFHGKWNKNKGEGRVVA